MHHLTVKGMRGRGLGQEFSFASKQVFSHVGVFPNQPYQRWAFYLWLMRILQKRFSPPASGMHQIAPSGMCNCTVRTLSRAPLNSCTHEHLLQPLPYKSKQRWMKSIILRVPTSTGTRLKLHMLLSPVSLQSLYLSRHKVSHSLPLQWKQSESLQVSLLWIPANCKYWSNGCVTALETIYAYLQEK